MGELKEAVAMRRLTGTVTGAEVYLVFNGQGAGGEGRSGLLQFKMSQAFGLFVTEDHYYSPKPTHTKQGANRRYSGTYLILCFTYDRIIDILFKYNSETCSSVS